MWVVAIVIVSLVCAFVGYCAARAGSRKEQELAETETHIPHAPGEQL